MNRFWPTKDKFDLEEEINKIRDQISRIETIKQLAQSKGWEELRNLMLEKVTQNDKLIIKLSYDPIKNENELRSREALRRSILGLLGSVDVLLGAETAILKRYQNIVRTTETSAPSFMAADTQ